MTLPHSAPVDVVDVVVRDGSTVSLRPAADADVPALIAFLDALSAESRYQRFLGMPALSPDRVRTLVSAGGGTGRSLVAETGGRIIAFAGYYRGPGDGPRAEVAFAIADAYQGRGIGTRLLERLAILGRRDGLEAFDAFVLGENRRMMDVFANSGFDMTRRVEDGVLHVVVSLSATPAFEERAAERARIAATASMKAFFEPRTVAVAGANRERGRIGAEILHNLSAAGFTGRIVPVHPDAAEIQGFKSFARVTDIPGDVDLAVIVVPAARVLDAADDCLAKDVRAICVISAGFAESGPEGRAREAALVERVRRAGARLIGPNCMGLLNTDPAFRLNATFSPVYPPEGRVAMSTQSGALGLAILDYAKRLGIGFSSFVSVGNKADVSGNDLIQYWAEDPHTSVILLYLESFGNPKKFSEIARRVGRTKPIAAVKAGRSRAGSRAASSHTGALASSDAVVDALFRQAGVIRTDRMEELFDVAALLSRQPIPRGRRVAILTNAGGPGILAADACEANGLEIPALGEATTATLRGFLPAAASVGNPVDMIASATPDHYRRALDALLRDDRVDSVIVIFIPPVVTDPNEVASAVAGSARLAADKPVLGVFMCAEGAPAALGSIPAYAFPESAAIALARVAAHGEWRAAPQAAPPAIEEFDREAARRIADEALARNGGWLDPQATHALLAAAGIDTAPARVATDAAGAVAAAAAIGYPVALKAVGAALLHKTERRAIRLAIEDEGELREAVADFEARFAGELSGLLVQGMITGGVEMIVGAVQDPQFGPVIACGTGGVLVDVLADAAFRLHPLSTADARGMIDGLRGARLLRGYRNAPPADEAALRGVLLRVSELVTVCPEIQELDLNPVMALPAGAVILDARIRMAPEAPRPATRRVEY